MASSPPPSPPSPSDDHMNESSSTDDEESNALRETDIRDRDAFANRSNLSVAELRVRSRRVYLESRKEKKVKELEEELADEEYLFKGVKLTKREEEEIKFKKVALNLAREHEKAQSMENIDRYHMPTGKTDETSKNDRIDQISSMSLPRILTAETSSSST